jgi:regulator of cell morphogenesis and NO signaling
MISKEMSMARAVLEHNQLLPLLVRFNIRLGFSEMNVKEVCMAHGVNPDFFLEIANAYLDDEFVPLKGLSHFSLGAVVEYLTATHSYYLDVALPRMERNILRLLDQSGFSSKEVKLVSGFFNDYKQEFLDHISREEKEILPYILELEQQSLKDQPDPAFIERLRSYSIKEFEKEHDRLEYSLENLSKLIIKYLPPFDDQELCIEVLRDLDELVKDLVDHADMEDKVLIPRVSELEQQLIQKSEAS